MISVIVSTYNRLELLKKALKTVLYQSFNDFEVIVVNDGSIDGTKQFLKTLEGDKFKVINLKHKGTDTIAKNEGIKQARGEYIAFLDDDNRYKPEHLAILYSEIKKDPELDMVYGDRMLVYEDGTPPALGHFSEFNPYLLMLRNYIDTSDVLVKKESLVSIGGFDERYKKYVDWNMWVRMAKAGMKFQRVPQIITEYYKHKNMKSARMVTKGEEGTGKNIPEWEPYELEIDLPYLHKPKEPIVAVFSLTKDRLAYTKKCFKSLQDKAGYPYDHYVYDNGSKDGTDKYLFSNLNFKLTHGGPENIGISKASNFLLDCMSEDYDIIIKYDNDCLSLSDNWIKTMVGLYKKNRMMCFSPTVEGLVDNPGGTPRLEYGKLDGHLLGITNHLGGICHVAPSSVYKRFRWNEKSTLHGLQDLELSQWLTKNGFQMAYVEDLRVEHYEGTLGQHNRYPEYFKLRKREKLTVYDQDK